MDQAELVAIPLFAAFALNGAFNVSDNWKIVSEQPVQPCFEAPGVIVDVVSVCELFLEPRIGAPRVGNLRHCAFSLICAGFFGLRVGDLSPFNLPPLIPTLGRCAQRGKIGPSSSLSAQWRRELKRRFLLNTTSA